MTHEEARQVARASTLSTKQFWARANELLWEYIGQFEGDARRAVVRDLHLLVLDYTRVPRVGQEIWGGSDICIIEPKRQSDMRWTYRRIGSTQLKER